MEQEIERIRLISRTIREYYHSTADFNGIEFNQLREKIGCSVEELATDLATLVLIFRDVTVVATNHFANPHIKSFDDLPVNDQIKILDTGGRGLIICLYPTEKALTQVVRENDYRDRPFTRKLYLGEPQLRYYTFELNVLAPYQDDPRCLLDFDGVHGQIYLQENFRNKPETYDRDKVFLKTFGLAYNENNVRAIAVYLRYLSRLTPEHQQIWNAKLISGDFKRHPDYYRQTILAEWEERTPVFRAFVGEIQAVNTMCELMGKPKLFRHDYAEGNKRPGGLEPLYRSTSKAYYDFALLLDKMLSDDINKDFFRGELDLENEVVRKDGKIEIKQKGTINLLEEWLNKYFQHKDHVIEKTFARIRKIRGIRQYPAHKILEDEYDPSYFDQQQNLISDAYEFVHNLRLIIADHPKAKSYQVPDWLDRKVQTF